MKKLLLFSIILMTSLSSFAGSYFTTGVRDTVWVNPLYLGLVCEVNVRAHFEYRFDSWTMNVVYPTGLSKFDIDRDYGMDVPYVKSDGTNDIYEAVLTENDTMFVYSSTITEYGYWDSDNDGNYECYGTVKWEPGEYASMFKLKLNVSSSFRLGVLVMSGELISTYDARGGTGSGYDEFEKSIVFKVGYHRGDINGDGNIDINDVTILNAYVLGSRTLDEFQLEAADVNGDGLIDINDVTYLIAIVLGS